MRTASLKYNRNYLIFIVFFYFFLFRNWLEQSISFVGYGDELFALLAVPIFINQLYKNGFKLKSKQEGITKYVVIFFIIGIISSAIYMYQNFLTTALPDAFLCLKFWLSLYVGKHIFSRFQIERYGKRIYGHVKFVTTLYLVLLLIDWVWDVFPAQLRYGMRSTHLIYSIPSDFVGCCVFLIMILLIVKDYSKGYRKWLVFLLLLICSTLRSKAFGTALAVVMICYFIFYRKKKIRLRTLIMFVPLVILIGWEQIEYYFFSSIRSDSARYQLLIKSFGIAKDHFPFGSGFGTYASWYSAVEYSPLYRIYGLSGVHGLREGAASFVSDSFWPMIIGQTGIFGTIAYLMVVVKLFKAIQGISKISLSYYAAALCGICYVLIASFAEAAFVHPLAVPVAALIGFLLSQVD